MKKANIRFKTPITYYGGKQKLLPYILPRIPQHRTYVEPFLGGAAVFFAKQPSILEVLNDTNGELINFYRVMQNDFAALEKEIRVTLHSRSAHKKAWVVNQNPDMFSEVKRAWAIWVLSSQSFSAQLDGSWGYDKTCSRTTKVINGKKEAFTVELGARLQDVQIECTDALYVIATRDTPDTFFYLDPPYYNSDCGHYDGYSIEDFEALLKRISAIKGKFMMSSYPSDILQRYSKKFGWSMWSVEKQVTVNAKSGYLKRKVEVLTANYPL